MSAYVTSFAIGIGFFLPLLYASWTDFRKGLIDDCCSAVLFLAGCLLAAYNADFSAAFEGCLAGAGSLYLIRFLSRGGLGFGDVKLAGGMGVWLGVEGVLTALGIAFLTGGLFAIPFLLFLKNTPTTRIPFGPFLAGGGALAYFYGDFFWSWYVALFQL